MESFPPEMQTAIRSPGTISSYRLTAAMKGFHSSLRTPEEVAACPASFTGQYLKKMLER